jgi:uncharacterized protein YneF (UPF0154 family)
MIVVLVVLSWAAGLFGGYWLGVALTLSRVTNGEKP